MEIEKEVLREKVARTSEAHRKSQVDIEKLRQDSLRSECRLMCTCNIGGQNVSRLNSSSESPKLNSQPYDDDILNDCSTLISSQVKSPPGGGKSSCFLLTTEKNIDSKYR
eukprot:TRINITY_DN8787_c0_g1_i1.p1 TRINITY_DN8787_c0_g1~~TRINITY_DN8787_c0_g1_i1.p1  ORF type:complete len:110 (+),score=7.01 TRINITY_DN8787_c0_g1_i1:84-413(+)